MKSVEPLSQFIKQKQRLPAAHLKQLVAHVGQLPLATDLLAADPVLWGSFWQFDVIAPGYSLPVAELVLLRATRLDRTWPEGTTAEQFLADLHRAVVDPEAGVWLLEAAKQPCVVFAAADKLSGLVTVVWYCASTDRLHAGYRSLPRQVRRPPHGTVEQRNLPLGRSRASEQGSLDHRWLDDAIDNRQGSPTQSIPARLDIEILRIRRTAVVPLSSNE